MEDEIKRPAVLFWEMARSYYLTFTNGQVASSMSHFQRNVVPFLTRYDDRLIFFFAIVRENSVYSRASRIKCSLGSMQIRKLCQRPGFFEWIEESETSERKTNNDFFFFKASQFWSKLLNYHFTFLEPKSEI